MRLADVGIVRFEQPGIERVTGPPRPTRSAGAADHAPARIHDQDLAVEAARHEVLAHAGDGFRRPLPVEERRQPTEPRLGARDPARAPSTGGSAALRTPFERTLDRLAPSLPGGSPSVLPIDAGLLDATTRRCSSTTNRSTQTGQLFFADASSDEIRLSKSPIRISRMTSWAASQWMRSCSERSIVASWSAAFRAPSTNCRPTTRAIASRLPEMVIAP